MVKKYNGNIEDLKQFVANTGISGTWKDGVNGAFQFKAVDQAILNWWPSNRTISFQGPQEPKENLQSMVLAELEGGNKGGSIPAKPKTSDKSIFIVHGHDLAAKEQLELVLHRLKINPFVLMNTSGDGKTIIEALEGKIGKDYSSDFGIALLTPDDMGYSKNDGPDKLEPRTRQNVILETGMLLASLTRNRMAVVVKGHLEIPSDLLGVIYLGYNDHVKEIVPKLCDRLRQAGFDISAEAQTLASS
ncbi:MAG: hypothetical protein A2527_01070 [Candidatus Lambdaproteobacteria bacterium RIFOXYD2_FULL_50_16]|uniref:CD-NTase-associated protein 12/Pycsar effector protein TIR domain-containing protein n=1 Tax=Candidatus Lambdaproteobacteria bacterium RIFOXYD2_FULL_50_16 TaxID=1817772 RepID=A0A1F6G9N0_9PROT|nr:MAG: hypothetical protein A2527_01070 [Candidatus Lambdaproteobacteria bacterium RIFOXYD2_FULL_50_16]